MSVLERIYKLDQMFREQHAVSMRQMQEELSVSRATLKRDLMYMRDRLNAPVVWDRGARGYRLKDKRLLSPVYLSPIEVQALLVLHQLLSRTQPPVAQEELAGLKPLLKKITRLDQESEPDVDGRVRLLTVGSRPVSARIFEVVAAGVLNRKQIRIAYLARSRGVFSERDISAQRMVHYRDNWYVDAWCHLRQALRSFSVDAIQEASLLAEPAIDVSPDLLDRDLGAGYGIFAGCAVQTARLRFWSTAARWVSTEHWHSDQKGYFKDDGQYVLSVPYASDRELIKDVLRYGADVEVLAPESLRIAVRLAAEAIVERYKELVNARSAENDVT